MNFIKQRRYITQFVLCMNLRKTGLKKNLHHIIITLSIDFWISCWIPDSPLCKGTFIALIFIWKKNNALSKWKFRGTQFILRFITIQCAIKANLEKEIKYPLSKKYKCMCGCPSRWWKRIKRKRRRLLYFYGLNPHYSNKGRHTAPIKCRKFEIRKATREPYFNIPRRMPVPLFYDIKKNW